MPDLPLVFAPALTALTAALALMACPSTVEKPPTPPLSQVRGDPTPPAWATPDLGWAKDPVYLALYEASAQTIDDLSSNHLVCAVTAILDGNPLDGPADLEMTWELGSRTVMRRCGVDETPCIVGFGRGEIAANERLRLTAIDEDDPPDEDDLIGTLEGQLEDNHPFAIETRALQLHCRVASPELVREHLAPLLRVDIPKRMRTIERPDDGNLYGVQNDLVRATQLTGWDHPDVWPLVRDIAAILSR